MVEEVTGNIAPSRLYALETLRADDEFVISRARCVGEPASVLTVTTAAQDPSVVSLAQLKHAYAFRDELDGAWAARPVGFVQDRERLTLVLEDPGGGTA
jgi:hypothetical protein